MRADQANTRTVDVHDRAGNVVGSKDVVLYSGLLSQAHEDGLKTVRTSLVQIPTDKNGRLAIIKAEVETTRGLFEAIGDASPESVEADLAPHLIRVAETRAKARALRDAVNCGIVSHEELDGASRTSGSSDPGSGEATDASTARPQRTRSNGNGAARTAASPANGAPSASNGSEPMSEAQRRYLFRLLAGKGYHKEAATEHLKDLFQVDSLSDVKKVQAIKLIDEMLKSSTPETGGGGNGATARSQR